VPTVAVNAAALVVPSAASAPAKAAPVDPQWQEFLEWKAKKAKQEETLAPLPPARIDPRLVSVIFDR
jgi:hypothetical protein